MLALNYGCITHFCTVWSTVEMRAVICLVLAVSCVQAFNIKDSAKLGFGSALGYLKDLIVPDNHKNEWPYKQVKFNHPRQSPVDLITSKAVSRKLPTLEIVEPDLHGHKAKFYNSGHTVYVYMNDAPQDRPQLKGGPLLEDTFYFEQMHFHWGGEDLWGSEHFIDGQSFAAEIHMVHWNSKYGTFENAATKDDGLAVLTVFAEGKNKTDNELLNPLYNLLSNISEAGSSLMMDTHEAMQWAVSALSQNNEYYTYPGSLTTEPYSENVVFILLPKPIYLSYDQLHAFRTIHSSHGNDLIVDNKRNLQPLHNRPIVRASNIECEH